MHVEKSAVCGLSPRLKTSGLRREMRENVGVDESARVTRIGEIKDIQHEKGRSCVADRLTRGNIYVNLVVENLSFGSQNGAQLATIDDCKQNLHWAGGVSLLVILGMTSRGAQQRHPTGPWLDDQVAQPPVSQVLKTYWI
jgi:hypothetical protein